MNSFGNGIVLPFLVIYLHDVRGFGLGVAGLVVAVVGGGPAHGGSSPPARSSTASAPRPRARCGLVLQAVGIGLLPLVRSPWQAFVLIAIEGAGSAGFWPSQSTLIARLTPAGAPARGVCTAARDDEPRHRARRAGRRADRAASRTRVLHVLFLLDAATFLAYVVRACVHPRSGVAARTHADAPQASYRAVLRDRDVPRALDR